MFLYLLFPQTCFPKGVLPESTTVALVNVTVEMAGDILQSETKKASPAASREGALGRSMEGSPTLLLAPEASSEDPRQGSEANQRGFIQL